MESSSKRPRRLRRFATVVLLGLLALAGAAGLLLHDAFSRIENADILVTGDPSRIYSASPRLAAGERLSAEELRGLFDDLGYRPRDTAGLAIGEYHAEGNRLVACLRRPAGSNWLEVRTSNGRIASVALDGAERDSLDLEPVLLATYYGPALIEHRATPLARVPKRVVQAVLAAEDADFYRHPGGSPRSIARAAWTNLRSGRVRQGGSTITQQLVKNVFLDPRRTLARKAREATLAVALEWKDDKQQILEAYLNEVYFGHVGPVQLVGLGAASEGYFGKAPEHLTLAEAALLAGMNHCPGANDPRDRPAPARARRDWVLARMASLGWIDRAAAAAAQAEPVETAEVDLLRARSAWFAQAAAQEASARYGVDVLRESGLTVHSTLDWIAQRRAEAVVARGLGRLERTIEAGHSTRAHPLEAALVSVDPRNGAILAYVGGRDRGRSSFDRARQSRRMLGSTFKPVVYAAAMEAGYIEPYTLLGDTAWSLDLGDRTWTPQNYDRAYHGLVSAQNALERSLNVPAAQLAMSTGLDRIGQLARQMGITSDIDIQPAMALGAVTASPLEVAAMFGTLADEGHAETPHAIAFVADRTGAEVPERLGSGTPVALSRETAYEITAMLRGVIDHGTGAGAQALGVTDGLAGKTGTSDDRRDVWFAGYAPDRVTVVWVGYDDNRPTRLSGASGALPLWSEFMVAMRPAAGYAPFPRPESMVTVTVDPATGMLVGPDCPMRVTVEMPDYRVPYFMCSHERPWDEDSAYDDEGRDPDADPSLEADADTTGILAAGQPAL
jgi:penicillin-binding protein 1B